MKKVKVLRKILLVNFHKISTVGVPETFKVYSKINEFIKDNKIGSEKLENFYLIQTSLKYEDVKPFFKKPLNKFTLLQYYNSISKNLN